MFSVDGIVALGVVLTGVCLASTGCGLASDENAEAQPKATEYRLEVNGTYEDSFKVTGVAVASEQYEKIPIKVVYICSDGTEIEFSSGICVVHRKDGSADSYTNAAMKREGKE